MAVTCTSSDGRKLILLAGPRSLTFSAITLAARQKGTAGILVKKSIFFYGNWFELEEKGFFI